MSPETLFRIQLVLGYVVCGLAFAVRTRIHGARLRRRGASAQCALHRITPASPFAVAGLRIHCRLKAALALPHRREARQIRAQA